MVICLHLIWHWEASTFKGPLGSRHQWGDPIIGKVLLPTLEPAAGPGPNVIQGIWRLSFIRGICVSGCELGRRKLPSFAFAVIKNDGQKSCNKTGNCAL